MKSCLRAIAVPFGFGLALAYGLLLTVLFVSMAVAGTIRIRPSDEPQVDADFNSKPTSPLAVPSLPKATPDLHPSPNGPVVTRTPSGTTIIVRHALDGPNPSPLRPAWPWAFKQNPPLTPEQKASGKTWEERSVQVNDEPPHTFSVLAALPAWDKERKNVIGAELRGAAYCEAKVVKVFDSFVICQLVKAPNPLSQQAIRKDALAPDDQKYLYELEKRLAKKAGEWRPENDEFDVKVQNKTFEFPHYSGQKWMGDLVPREAKKPAK